MKKIRTIIIDGKSLSLLDVILIARGQEDHPDSDDNHHHHSSYPTVEIEKDAKKALSESHNALKAYMDAGNIVYGVNTGCGNQKSTIIPPDQITAYQAHYIPAHCVGTGDYFDAEVTRAAMILRANSFCRGNSGIRLKVVDKIVELYNKGVIPAVPSQGSVGASGDLCPLAHMAATMMGLEGQMAFYKGETILAKNALAAAGIERLVLEAKEAMGLTNGSTFILSLSVLAYYDALNLYEYGNLIAALAMEAVRAEKNAFDPRVHESRGHKGSIDVARILLELTDGSLRMTDAGRRVKLAAETKIYREDENGKKTDEPVPRVQDTYSFRAHPQVMVVLSNALDAMKVVLEKEINASTDNPLVFKKEDGTFETRSGGNFHGEILAHSADNLKNAVTAIANISDRRFYNMLVPEDSYGLPGDLAGPVNKKLNTGLMILQYSTAALVHEMKILCTPSGVDSIPTSAGQEDYVSMGTVAARHLRRVVTMGKKVLAGEMMAAIQGIALTEKELKEYARLGTYTGYAYDFFLEKVDELPINEDRIMLSVIWEKVIQLMSEKTMYDIIG